MITFIFIYAIIIICFLIYKISDFIIYSCKLKKDKKNAIREYYSNLDRIYRIKSKNINIK